MANLVFILIAALLLIGFLTLTWYEERQGRRLVLAPTRSRLDQRLSRVQFIVEHVDLAAFVRDEIRRGMSQMGHAIVAGSLSAVRAIERLLTRLVRYLRTRHPVEPDTVADTRPFVKTLSAFKNRLKKTKPSDISQGE